MLLKNTIIAFVLCSVVICESAFVDTLTKCSKDDGNCQTKHLQKLLQDISESGVPEYGIPPTDPAELKDMKVSILDIIDITLNGVAKGVKNCVINSFTLDIEKCVAKLDITCDIVIKGKYKLFSNSPAIKTMFGNSIRGDGDGKVKIEKLNIKLVTPFKIVKRGNDIFLIAKRSKITYSFDILGKVTFGANQLFVGDKESSVDIIKLLNQEWKFIVNTFGKVIIEKAIDFIHNIANKFFSVVPTKYYIIEDLTPYVTKK